MREIALAALAFAALATLAAVALGPNRARTPDGAYRAAIVGALGICGLLASLALVLFKYSTGWTPRRIHVAPKRS